MRYLPGELDSFHRDVTDFCRASLPADIAQKIRFNEELTRADYALWEQLLNARGWYCGHWPQSLGGAGWTPLKRYIFEQALAEAGAPWMMPFGPAYIGPVLCEYGTPPQQADLLPAVLNSTTFWCQGYSEPGAGSDLAGLSTRAERREDHYLVNGQKLWTSYAQWADMMFCLVRTSREAMPQKGVSFILLDMKAPGVSVRPIRTMDERCHVNEVFLEDVKVPLQNLVGQEGQGWEIAKFLLATERLIVAETGKARRMLGQVRGLAAHFEVGGRPFEQDQDFRAAMTAAEIRLETLEAVCARELRGVAAGRTIGHEASLMKIRGSELLQQITGLAMRISAEVGFAMPAENQPAEDEMQRELDGLLREYLLQRAATIYGGSNEIQRNIVSKARFRF